MKTQSASLDSQEDTENENCHSTSTGRGIDTDMPDETKKEQKADDNAESSSTGSDGGKGGGSGGSGGGYSADCSSSDASSEGAAKGNVPEEEMKLLSVDGNVKKEKQDTKKAVKNSKSSTPKSQKPSRHKRDQADSSQSLALNQEKASQGSAEKMKGAEDSNDDNYSVPQWGGVRIRHPMDPRIDLSTVGHIHTSSLATTFPINVDIPNQQNLDSQASQTESPNDSKEATPPPSIDQYMTLMEVVRPFFHAHGISQGFSQPRSDDPSERSSSDSATGPSDTGSDQKSSAGDLKLEALENTSNNSVAVRDSLPNIDADDSDSSSMVVLARVKRKRLKKSAEDPANDGSNNSSNDGSNDSSSSDRRVRIQHPQHAEELKDEEPAANADDGIENEGEAGQESQQDDSAGRQESLSSSSSEGRNINQEAPQVAPLRYGGPAIVSEYSSSARTGSSGASNGNMMSTSGSGSGGNTGSGTGSGSNQGGSSGSGNDQEIISSNGNGSSGSGNDVKGSSEETMDNSGENNSGENSGGNSDGTNSNNKKLVHPASTSADTTHLQSGHRHAANTSEIRDNVDPAQSQNPIGEEDQNAVREKKLQDKKRKRMNMRREYEEKVQQEMESSEGSHDKEEVLIKPGRPVTLDKVLSFTKIARIVIKAGPPFLIVYTNAAYCQLSGIDSHSAVGKPISTILSIPEQGCSQEVSTNQEAPALENSTVAVDKTIKGDRQDENSVQSPGNQSALGSNPSQNHIAAEAAGRARAAASIGDSTEMCLERLVAASGFGKCHAINALSKPHHMLGRDVTVNKSPTVAKKRSREEGSNGSSITSSNAGPYHFVKCNMSVSPVVSSPEAFNVTVVSDKDQDSHHHKGKRRKHHHHSDSNQPTNTGHHQHRRIYVMKEASMHRKRHLITHYVIQLEPYDSIQKFGGLESQSSTSTTVEAHILGLTKSELRRQRLRTSEAMPPPENINRPPEDEEDEDMESESTEPKEPVTAMG